LSRTSSSAKAGQPIVIALGPTELDEHVSAFDPAEIAKACPQCRETARVTCRGNETQKADACDLRLLRARRERPSGRTAEQRDELAPM